MPYVSHTRVYHVMSPKLGQGIGRGPKPVRASGPPHGDTRSWGHGDTRDTRDMGTWGHPVTSRPLPRGPRDPMALKGQCAHLTGVTVASRPRRQKTCVFPSFFATPKLLFIREHNKNGVANVMWVPTARLNCRNLGGLGGTGFLRHVAPVDGGTSQRAGGNWGFN
jgi:hypothetical protein